MPSATRPVLFIHGLWLHSSSWRPWAETFDAAGYASSMPGWPGDSETVEATREQPEKIAGHGIDDIVDHFAGIIRSADAPPVLIGHSFGGLLVQKLLGKGLGCAGIAIDAAPIKGVRPVPLSALRAAFPVLRNPANRSRAVSLTAGQFRYAFGNALEPAESDALYERWAIPAPGKPLFQVATANLNRHSEAAVATGTTERGPLLLALGGRDHTVPGSVVRSAHKQYRRSDATTDLLEFPDRGHSLVIDSGWPEVADRCLQWLRSQSL
jgi:pimeloyl-ACP methyl ester carboxylesterase